MSSPKDNKVPRGSNLEDIDKEFKKHKKRQLFKKYFYRFLLIICLILFIITAYTLWVVGNVSAKLSSHLGISEAKEALVERDSPLDEITLMFLGSDTRGESRGRADTIIVVRLCPKEKRIVLISIPRDYRVYIPGYGTKKINSAYALGGAKLMIETVSEYLDIKINHYAVVDFNGFKKIVDALSGVTVTVEKRMYETRSSKVNLYPGKQKLNGTQALAYVRFRHDKEGDFGRIRRQQEFLRALGREFLTAKAVPKYPKLANIIAENLETDLSISQMISLVRLYSKMDDVDFQAVTLPGKPQMISGVSYVVPEQEKVDLIMSYIKEKCRLPSANELIDPSNISVRVFNGSGARGLASAGSNYLRDQGFRVLSSRNADSFDYVNTLIVYVPGREKEAKLVKDKLGFGEISSTGEEMLDKLGGAYVGVILGQDSESKQPIKERLTNR